MENVVTFIIPVRHQDNAKNWSVIKKHLTATIRSIANQDSDGWRCVIVANHGADLPETPNGFEVVRVDFEPNPIFAIDSAPIEDVYEAVRRDKGRRILAGLLYAKKMGHVMIVDDDDFISRKITSFILQNQKSNGFVIEDGYIWEENGRWLFHYDGNFARLCGTSHIVRADLYDLPESLEDASDEYIQTMLGSHIFIGNYLDKKNTPLTPLPFIGAVYRVGHSENHSRASGMMSDYILNKWLWRNPVRQFKRVFRLKRVNQQLINEYFGGNGQGN